jgi:hypothetical protein
MNLSAISLHFLQITFITILALDNALLSEVPRGRDDRKSSFNFLKLVGGNSLKTEVDFSLSCSSGGLYIS